MEKAEMLRGGDFVEVETTVITVDPTLQPIDSMSSYDAMQMEAFMEMMGAASVAINIFYIITFLLTAWGLYLINKKLGEEHPWIAFIPVVQVWSYFTAAQKSFVKYFVYPVIALILGSILGAFTFGITTLLALVYMVYCWITVLNAISLRTGRGAWSTIGMFFVPWIMLPVIGVKLEDGGPATSSEAPAASAENTKTETKKEL